ncbi:MAG: energy transducer TonB [Terracidiphilus sp.]|jgi:TonB family protein
MKKKQFSSHCIELRPAGVRGLRRAALALALALAISAGAADTRAVKTRVAPVYPEIAKRMRIVGEVKFSVTVDPEGNVVDVKKVSGNTMLSAAAEDAVRKWKFESGAGTATVEVSLNFALGQ